MSWYQGTLCQWADLIIKKQNCLHQTILASINLNWLSLKSTQCAQTTQVINCSSTTSTQTNKSYTTILHPWLRLHSTITNRRTPWQATTLTSLQLTCSKVGWAQVSWRAPPTSTTRRTTSTSTISTQRFSISNNKCHSLIKTTAARLAAEYISKRHLSTLRICDRNWMSHSRRTWNSGSSWSRWRRNKRLMCKMQS